MQVLVDTCIWSLVLRRSQKNTTNEHREQLSQLIEEHRVKIIGAIRQEILSGIREAPQFLKLKQHLAAFPDLILQSADYEKAAEFSNTARNQGIQGSAIDYLICAVSHSYHLAIYTIDHDFENYAKYLPIKLLGTAPFL
jgi:predicted nucleic acid-binding protein